MSKTAGKSATKRVVDDDDDDDRLELFKENSDEVPQKVEEEEDGEDSDDSDSEESVFSGLEDSGSDSDDDDDDDVEVEEDFEEEITSDCENEDRSPGLEPKEEQPSTKKPSKPQQGEKLLLKEKTATRKAGGSKGRAKDNGTVQSEEAKGQVTPPQVDEYEHDTSDEETSFSALLLSFETSLALSSQLVDMSEPEEDAVEHES
ncbi:ribosome biogenesis protein BOP1 [Arapaima gigas]